MTGKVAAFLATVAQAAGAIGLFMISSDAAPFDFNAHDWGLALAWVGNIATFIVLAIRRNMIPGWETGVGNEPQGVVKTTTLETKTEVTP